MSDKVYLPMEPKMRDELRYAMNTQFRYKLYRDPVFPFLPSLGIDHIVLSFEAQEELGFVGVLHLWYENESGELSYHTKDKRFVAGHWKHEWYDRPEDAVALAIHVQKSKPYNEDKLIQVAIDQAKRVLDMKKKKIEEQEAEEESEDTLLN